MVDYKPFLASRVLNEGKPITYRLLSRELKVHVNVAKQMLWDFYTSQNAKRPGSVNASYWVTGKKRPQASQAANGTLSFSQDGEDSFMMSSPFASSMPQMEEDRVENTGFIESHIIVREEEIEDTLAGLEELIAIHVYSLQPGPLENMNLLSTCSDEVRQRFAKEDSLETWKTYGTIRNPYIKRRTQRLQPIEPAAPPAAAKIAPKPSSTFNHKDNNAASIPARRGSASEEGKPEKPATLARSSSGTAKKPEPKVQRKGADFFKASFAMAKPKAKKAEVESPKESPPVEDESMMDVSEDEFAEDFVSEVPETKEAKEKREAADRERKARDEKLKHIFDDDDKEDVPMDDAPEEEEEEDSSHDSPINKAVVSKPAEPEPVPTVTGGRRRLKRKIIKKKTVKDEDGFLVTTEEPEWESYSEDEPQPKKPKIPAVQPSSVKGKKGAKPEGRSIASFFTKPKK